VQITSVQYTSDISSQYFPRLSGNIRILVKTSTFFARNLINTHTIFLANHRYPEFKSFFTDFHNYLKNDPRIRKLKFLGIVLDSETRKTGA